MKIRHISGVVAEVDDEYGKQLVAASGEWKRVRRTPVKATTEDTDNEE